VSDETEAGRAVPGTPDDAAGESPRVQPEATDGGARSEATDAVSMVKDGETTVEGAADVPEASVRESALVGASAGSARAAARRSGARAGSSPVKGTATAPRDVSREKRLSLLARLRRFLREVVAELRKVIWPARNQMVTYTIVVIVFVVIMVALTAVLDVLFAKGVLSVFG
jgi:preprotein translocase subunit SecE